MDLPDNNERIPSQESDLKLPASFLAFVICCGLGLLIGTLCEGNNLFQPDNPLDDGDSVFAFDFTGIWFAFDGFLGAACGVVGVCMFWLGRFVKERKKRQPKFETAKKGLAILKYLVLVVLIFAGLLIYQSSWMYILLSFLGLPLAGSGSIAFLIGMYAKRITTKRVDFGWKSLIKTECVILLVMALYATVEYRVARQPHSVSSFNDVSDAFINSSLFDEAQFIAGRDQTTDHSEKYELIYQIPRSELHKFIADFNASLLSGAAAIAAEKSFSSSLFGQHFNQWRAASAKNYRIGTMNTSENGDLVHRTVLFDLDAPNVVTIYLRYIFDYPTQLE